MRLLKKTLLVFFIILNSCAPEDNLEQDKTKFTIDLALTHQNDIEMSTEILKLINNHRVSIGLSQIKMSTRYASAFAVDHTLYMIEKEQINHDNFSYRSEGIKHHDGADTVAENLAFGYETAEEVVYAWLKSETHKTIIEGNYTHTGFGILKCEKGRVYFTQLFYRK